EHLQRGGSYKIRPASFSLVALDPAVRRAGVIAASGGNFAVSLALAASELGVRATLVVPPEGFEEKRHLLSGAEVIVNDRPGYDAAEERAKALAKESGRAFLSPTEGEAVYSGNAQIAEEILASAPVVSAICAPVGGGGLAIGLARYA